MQTRKPGLRALTLALAGVLTLGLAACEETETVQPQQQTTLTISPSGTVDLEVGDRVTVVANLLNAPTGATVTWASSNTAVATVDQTGNVTAVGPGIATITASATGNNNQTVRAALAVRVTADDPEEEPEGDESVFITGITNAAGDPIPTTDVSGTVVVRLEVEPGNADSLVVSIGDRRACAISFGAATALVDAEGNAIATAQVPLSCTVNTATLGAVNGATTLSARLFNDGTVVASNQQSITLTNVSTVSAAISTAESAINPQTGLVWNDGDVTVTATPQIFSGAQIARVTFTLNGDDVDVDAVTDTAATDGVFSATFDEEDLEDVVDATFFATITATTTAGEQFNFPLSNGTTATSLNTASIRYDNAAPEAAADFLSDAATDFLGEGEFDELVDVEDIEEELGVDGVDLIFFASEDTDLDFDEVIEEGDTVTSAEDLEEGEEFIIAALACDELENCVELEGFTFVVDLTAPEIVDIAPEDTAVYNAAEPAPLDDVVVEITDDEAGFEGTGLFVSATRTFISGGSTVTRCVIGDEATGANITAAFSGNIAAADTVNFQRDGAADSDTTCEPVEIEQSIPLPQAAGYYDFQIQALDAAGNLSDAEELIILVDEAAPGIDDIDFSASLDGGESETLSATLEDNLDLHSYSAGLVYLTSLGFVPVTQEVEVDGSFGAPLTDEEDVSSSVFFVATITEDADPGEGFLAGNQDDADVVDFRVLDQAGNLSAPGGQGIAQNFTAPTAAAWAALIESYEVDVVGDDDVICIEAGCDGEDAVTLRAVVEEDVADDSDAPIEQVQFYVRVNGRLYLVGTDTDASTSVTTDVRRFTFTTSLTREFLEGLTGTEIADEDVLEIIGLAADEDGNGIFEATGELTAEDDD